MAQDSLQCLAQLASMHGPIFPDESAQVSYLAHLVEGLLSMINGSVSLWFQRICGSQFCARRSLGHAECERVDNHARSSADCSLNGCECWSVSWLLQHFA